MIASVREVTVIASAIGPHVPNSYAVVTLFEAIGKTVVFDDILIEKVWSDHHTMIINSSLHLL